MNLTRNFFSAQRTSYLRASLFLALTLFTWGYVTFFLAPPFYTFDSYHYLALSIRPLAADAHSFGFGWILLGLAKIADVVGTQSYVYLYLFYNCALLVFPFFYAFVRAFELALPFEKGSRWRLGLAALIVVLYLPFAIAGGLFLVNSVWPEITSVAQVFLLAALTARLSRKWNYGLAALTVFGVVYAYHTRYIMIIMPLVFIGLGVAPFILRRPDPKFPSRGFIFIGLASFAVIFLTNEIADRTLPQAGVRKWGISFNVQGSMQCALRCDVALYPTNCSTPEGRAVIESARCTEILFRLKPLGDPIIPYVAPLPQLFKYVGWKKTLTWILKAPFTYLNDIHSLEMGLFKFDLTGQPTAELFAEAVNYYLKYFDGPLGQKAKPRYISIVQQVDRWFGEYRIYHKLTALAVVGCLLLVFTAKEPTSQFLAWYTVGNFLLFSYLNAHVPFRFLWQILVPGFLALVIGSVSIGRYAPGIPPKR